MTNESIKKAVAAVGVKFGAIVLSPSTGESQESSIGWIKLIEFAKPRLELGLSVNGYWVRSTPNGLLEVKSLENLVSLLPCLEVSYRRFTECLANGIGEFALPQELLAEFPWQDLVQIGLRDSASAHWQTLALEWAKHLDLIEPLVDILKIMASKGKSQELRHNAKHILKEGGKWNWRDFPQS